MLLKNDVEDLYQVLLSESDYKLPLRLIGDNWREVIAAIHFGVTKEAARELLLRGRIETALADGEGTTLSDLASDQPRGFWAVLDDSVPRGAENWNELKPDELARAAVALVDSRLLDHTEKRTEAMAVRMNVRNAALSVQSWIPFDAANASGMVAIARLVDTPDELIPALMATATKAFQGQVSPEMWIDSALKLIEGFVELGLGTQIKAVFNVPLDDRQWVSVSPMIAKKDPKVADSSGTSTFQQ